MDSFAWSTTLPTPCSPDYYAAYEQGQWAHGDRFTAVPVWEPLHTDPRIPQACPPSKNFDAGADRHAYQNSFAVLNATPYMDPAFFTAEKSSGAHAAAPPALSPSPPFNSASSSSSASPIDGTSSVFDAASPMSAAAVPRLSSPDNPADHKSGSPPSSPDSPEVPLNFAKERRRAQNRKAQQTHRERRAQRVKDLEGRVKELESLEHILRAENGELKEELMRLEGMLRTAQLCRDAGHTVGFPDPVAMWNLIQKHPMVATGEVDVAMVCEKLRSLLCQRGDKASLIDARQIDEVIGRFAGGGETD